MLFVPRFVCKLALDPFDLDTFNLDERMLLGFDWLYLSLLLSSSLDCPSLFFVFLPM